MQALNFPTYPLNIRVFKEKKQIFDRLRKKFVALTPEEWVRQHLVWYLIEELHYPMGLIKLEHYFIVNNSQVRSDLVVYTKDANPILLAECKAPNIKIGNSTLQQAGRYNIVTKTKYLLVTNGITNICCIIDFVSKKTSFIKNIPDYQSL